MNKKKLNEEIAENIILANFSYISKTLSKIENYKFPKNPYSSENGYLRNIFLIINSFISQLNQRYPISQKFNDALFIPIIDFCEELFDEKSIKQRSENTGSNILDKSIVIMLDELHQFAEFNDYKNVFDHSIYLDYRFKMLSSNLRKINKNLFYSLLTIYTVHLKKIKRLSTLSRREMRIFNKDADVFISKLSTPELKLNDKMLNSTYKHSLEKNLFAHKKFYRILPDNTKLVQNLYENSFYFYNSFLNSKNGIFSLMKSINRQNTHQILKSMNIIHQNINEDIKMIFRIRRSLKFIYLTVGKKI
ncbi:MAG TPA: hypothetical protein PKE39_05075 [Ignavibacteria bacterium]|nr:hypothetical protein [Ignavibacteria bacterium]HMQ98377.1 hypothetical protein [Ignavibacteria bacterium]